jgi:hypothetical protein
VGAARPWLKPIGDLSKVVFSVVRPAIAAARVFADGRSTASRYGSSSRPSTRARARQQLICHLNSLARQGAQRTRVTPVVCSYLFEERLVELCWLANATSWPGYERFAR